LNKDKTTFFIGDVSLDEYYSAPYFPKPNDKVLLQTLPAQMGGSIANAACVYTSFGPSASFLTALNHGPLSQRLCAGLNRQNIDTTHMVWDETLPDSKCIIIITGDENTVLIPTLNLQAMEISEATFEALCHSDYIYSTFCELRPLRYQGMNAVETLKRIMRTGCRLWCDLDVADVQDGDEPFFELVDTMFINDFGYERLAQHVSGNPVEWMVGKGIQRVVVTHGDRGCTLFSSADELRMPGIPVEVVDVTGAGDTFCSAFLFAHTSGLDVRQCAEFANAAAALAVTAIGARAGAVGVRRVLEFMMDHGIDTAPYGFLATD